MEENKAQHPLGKFREVNRPPPEIDVSPPHRQVNDKPQGGSPPTESESGSVNCESNDNHNNATKQEQSFKNLLRLISYGHHSPRIFGKIQYFFKKFVNSQLSLVSSFHDVTAFIVLFAASHSVLILDFCCAFRIGWRCAHILSSLGFAPYSFWSCVVILTSCGVVSIMRKLHYFNTLLGLLEWLINQMTNIDIDDL